MSGDRQQQRHSRYRVVSRGVCGETQQAASVRSANLVISQKTELWMCMHVPTMWAGDRSHNSGIRATKVDVELQEWNCSTIVYLPTQKLEKMRPRMSSGVMSPARLARSLSAARMAAA